jgi:hypothetical protein
MDDQLHDYTKEMWHEISDVVEASFEKTNEEVVEQMENAVTAQVINFLSQLSLDNNIKERGYFNITDDVFVRSLSTLECCGQQRNFIMHSNNKKSQTWKPKENSVMKFLAFKVKKVVFN